MQILKLRLMHILFISMLPIFVCTVVNFQSEFSFATDSVFQIRFKAQIARNQHSMPIRTSWHAVAVQALGFKSISYDAEFASRRAAAAADCHRRRLACSGSACADRRHGGGTRATTRCSQRGNGNSTCRSLQCCIAR